MTAETEISEPSRPATTLAHSYHKISGQARSQRRTQRRSARAWRRTPRKSEWPHDSRTGTVGSALTEPGHLCFRLLQPIGHAHLAVHRRRGGAMLMGLDPLAVLR